MEKFNNYTNLPTLTMLLFSLCIAFQSCAQNEEEVSKETLQERKLEDEKPEYFSLRPDVEKAFGYSQAVKVGNIIKVSGVVSMDNSGNPTAVGDLEKQMKNCYASLKKILDHYDCSFDDVIVENIFTTDMALFLETASYRRSIYTKQFPTGTWLGVQELAVPVFMIEIELEVYKPN